MRLNQSIVDHSTKKSIPALLSLCNQVALFIGYGVVSVCDCVTYLQRPVVDRFRLRSDADYLYARLGNSRERPARLP